MNCRSVREQLWSNRGEVTQAAMQAHLGGCSTCAEAAVEVKRMRSWLHELPAEEPSATFDWRLRLRLSQASKASEPLPVVGSRWAPRAPMQFASSMAAAAVVVLAVGLLWTRSRGPEPIPVSGPVTVTTPGTVNVPGPAPSVVQVRGRSGFGDGQVGSGLENSATRSDSDSIRVTPPR